MKRLRWALEFLVIVVLTLPFAFLPHNFSSGTGRCLGDLLHFLWRSRRKIAETNLASAVSRNAIVLTTSPEEVIRQNFRNLGRSFIEIVKIYYGRGGRILENITIEGIENFTKAHQKGRGVLAITGHCGNWELSALIFSFRVMHFSFVARSANNPYVNRLIERTREKFGNHVIYKKGALKGILSALKRNEPVGILMDQSVVESEGVMAEFLGKKDYIMKTPALIAMKTGSPVLPVFIRRDGTGHRLEIGEEIELDTSEDVERAVFNNTVKFSWYVEQYIRKYPEEWLWIHRRWKRVKEQA